VPERKPLEVWLDGKGQSQLELLAKAKGITPEQLTTKIMNEALDRMTRPPRSRSNVASIGRKG